MYRIAHISDLHVSELDDENLSNLQWLAKILGKRLRIDVVADKHDEDKLNALKTVFSMLRPNLIIVTGDITNFGDEKSFDKAAEILSQLKEIAGASRIICIPGNHDSLCERVAELKSRGLFGRGAIRLLALLNQEIAISSKEAAKLEDGTSLSLLGNYRNFSTGRYDRVDPSNPVFVETAWGELAIFLFNSTNDAGIMANEGRIGEKQYNALNMALNNPAISARIGRAVRMALLHHHPITVPDIRADAVERGYNWMVDGVLFSEYLGRRLGRNNFHFILHGHQHEPYVFRNAPGLNAHIVAAGSALAGSNSNRGSFNVIDLITPFEARVRRFDYSPTGYAENSAKREENLPVRSISTVRLSPEDYPITGEDLALQGTVKGRKEAYDEDRQYDLLEYKVTVTPDQNYIAEYRRKGRVVRDKLDEGIIFSINGNPPKSFPDIGVTATGKSNKSPDITALKIELIDDKRTEMVFRARHTKELEKGDKFDIKMNFHWQSNADLPNHYDGVNLMYFKYTVGCLVYQVRLPWNPPNPKVIAYGIEEEPVDMSEAETVPNPDGTFLYSFKIYNPKPLAYLITFVPQ